jgi:3-oxoacyl-[acyl-carrier protein] reductase
MEKRIALVLGGSGGIGRSIVRTLLNDDFHVHVGCYHDSELILKDIELMPNHRHASCCEIDLLDRGSIDAAVSGIINKDKHIDVIVHAATLQTRNQALFMKSWKDFDLNLQVQAKALYDVVEILKPQLKEQHRTKFIIILSETCIGRPPKGLADYIMAKYALMGLAKVCAVELAPFNCTVNMISPGMVQTALIRDLPPKLIEITASQNPQKRIGLPVDVAGVVSFLASDKADYLNGVNITVNGGGIML